MVWSILADGFLAVIFTTGMHGAIELVMCESSFLRNRSVEMTKIISSSLVGVRPLTTDNETVANAILAY